MRVFHVISGFENGGVETLLYRLISHMPRDIEFHIVAHEIAVPACAARFERLGVTVHLIPNRKHWFKHQKALLCLFSKYRPTVVHVHTTEWGMLALCAAKRAGVPCRIQHSHAARNEKNPFVRLFHKLAFGRACRAATAYFACGRDAALTAFGKRAMAQKKVTVLQNGIDVAAFAYNAELRAKTRAALGIAADATAIGMVARFSPQKNHVAALSIFHAYYKAHPNTVLLLVGEGRLRASTEALARRILPPHAVRFLGVRSDMPALYSAMDRFILPSRFEGLPITLIEAQAAGLSCAVANTVTREADFSGLVSFLNIAEEAEWVKALAAPPPHARTGYDKLAAASGYRLADSAAALYEFYKNQV